MHLGTLNLWYKAASYKPKFIVPQMHFHDSPARLLGFCQVRRVGLQAGTFHWAGAMESSTWALLVRAIEPIGHRFRGSDLASPIWALRHRDMLRVCMHAGARWRVTKIPGRTPRRRQPFGVATSARSPEPTLVISTPY